MEERIKVTVITAEGKQYEAIQFHNKSNGLFIDTEEKQFIPVGVYETPYEALMYYKEILADIEKGITTFHIKKGSETLTTDSVYLVGDTSLYTDKQLGIFKTLFLIEERGFLFCTGEIGGKRYFRK